MVSIFIRIGLAYFFISILICKESFAQVNNVKIDTVRLKVYYIKYFDSISVHKSRAIDLPSKSVVVPAKRSKKKDIPYFQSKENNFNGLFLVSEDDLVSNGGVIAAKTNKKLSDFAADLKGVGLPTDFTNYKYIPNAANLRFNMYAAYSVDAIWLKYSIFGVPNTEVGWPEKYKKKVANSDGRMYNFYLVHKIKSFKSLDQFFRL